MTKVIIHNHLPKSRASTRSLDASADPLGKKFGKLIDEHMKEAKRQRARFENMGWGTTANGIESQTSKGILQSRIDKNGKVTHSWDWD